MTTQPHPHPVPGPASGPIAAARRPRRATALAVLIACLSLVLAGVIGGFRDAVATSTRIDLVPGQTVDLVDGQTITLVQVSGGVSLSSGHSSGLSQGRFISLRIITATQHQRKLLGMTCRAILAGREWPTTIGNLMFPESGQQTTTQVVIEVPTEGVGAVQLACRDSAAVYVRAADVHFQLGIEERVPQFLAETGFATITVTQPTTEGMP